MQGPRVSPLHRRDWEVGESTLSLRKEMPSPTPSSERTLQQRGEHIAEAFSLIPEPHPTTYPPTRAQGWGPARGPAPLCWDWVHFHQLQCGTLLKPDPWEALGSEASQLISQAGTFLHVRQKGIQSRKPHDCFVEVFRLCWDIMDIWHCVSLRCATWFDILCAFTSGNYPERMKLQLTPN